MTAEELIFTRNEKLAGVILKELKSRNMNGYYAKDRAEALDICRKLIPEGSTVTRGGSMTCDQIGLTDELRKGNYDFRDREKSMTPEDKRALELFAYEADVFVGSANAITEDGILVNIDGNSNRVSAYAYGPRKLVLIVGMNKVAPDLDAALKRARNTAAPINAQRFGLDTPCAKTGKCFDCKSPDSICCNFLVTRFSRNPERIHVVLVNDNLGF